MNREIKNKKRIKLKNKKLLKKYPWLMPRNVWTGKIDKDYDYSYTLLDWIPTGWRKCFGMMMIKEMDQARNGGTIFTQDIKEKYGTLRWYCSANKDVQKVIDKYEIISANVCIYCGQPDVCMTMAGWYYPCCKKCWNKNKYNIKQYEEVIDKNDDGKMRDSYSYTIYSPNNGEETVVIDISDTVNKIRNKYRKGKNNA